MSYQLDNIRHLRFWANKVLPLVYDESLSYYECICKIMDAINHLIEVEDLQNNAITDLDNRATSLEGRMDTAESDIDAVENRATALENRATSLEGRMSTAEGDIDSLEGRMNTAENDIDAVENRATTLENRATSLEGRMTTAESDIDAVENRATALENRATSLEGRMTTAEGDIDNLESDMTTAQGDITALQGRATALETRSTNLEGRMTSAESDIDSLESDMTTAQGDITALQGRATSLEGRMTTAESDIDSLENDMTTAQENITALRGRATSLESDMTTAQGDITALQDRATSIEGRMSAAEGDIDVLENELTSKEDKGDSLIDYVAARGYAFMDGYSGFALDSNTLILDGEWSKAYSTFGKLVGQTTALQVDRNASTFFTPVISVQKNADGTNKPVYIYHDTNTASPAKYEQGMGSLGDIKVIYYGVGVGGEDYVADANYFVQTLTGNITEFTPPATILHMPSNTEYTITSFRLLLPFAWSNLNGGGLITYDPSRSVSGDYPSKMPINGGNEESVRGAIFSTAFLAMNTSSSFGALAQTVETNNLASVARDTELGNDIDTIQRQIGNFTFVTLTQAQYDAITTPDANTVYLIVG